MNSRLVVTTTCATCSAPLDFTEGSNAVQCGYCGSNLLVTGHKQVLSYVISPKLPLERAVARVMLAHNEQGLPCRVIKPQLYFVPYYRLSGHDFRWESGWQSSSAEWLELGTVTNAGVISAVLDERTIQFRDRYVEKNFIACNLGSAAAPSLGIRPTVLRLELFRREYLESIGHIVPLNMSPKEALVRGMKTVGRQALLYRQVLGHVLSVVYFPYWVIEVEREGKTLLTTMDAVSARVIKLDAPPSLITALHGQSATTPVVIGFRPLVCPNCGWDLPFRPNDVIFFCTACERAWEILGSNLRAVSYQMADVSLPSQPAHVDHLPFWVLQLKDQTAPPGRFFLPAFRYRRLKLLADLARRMTAKQPRYGTLKEPKPDVHGCYYDRHDAMKLAGFIYVGLQSKRLRSISAMPRAKLSFASARLTWFPFTRQRQSLIDPFTGLNLPQNGLL